MPEQKVLNTSDLDAHRKESPNSVHGIMDLIRDMICKQPTVFMRAYLSADHTGLTANDWEQVLLDSETEDVEGTFNMTTALFTAPAAGLYIVDALATVQNNGAASQKFRVGIFKNGSLWAQGDRNDGILNGAINGGLSYSEVMRLAAGDTLGLYVYCSTANNMKILGGTTLTWMTICFLR